MKTEFSSARRFLDSLCAEMEGPHLLVGLSGGEDSMCLTHFVRAWCAERGAKLTAAHLNHGLRGASAARDENFVREHCGTWDVPLVVEHAAVGAYAEEKGKSIEEAGRELRYDFLQRTARELGCDWILTAHHANDNAETVLFNLLRGTGSRGLGGIPPVRGNIARPLLEITRVEISAYALRHGIGHVTDECNLDPEEATRNLLRQQVLPVLERANPRAVENINRAAATLRRESEAIDALARERLGSLVCSEGVYLLDRAALLTGEEALCERAALMLLGEVCGARRDIGAVHVAALLRLAEGGGRGQIDLPYGVLARRRGEKIELVRAAKRTAEEQFLRAGERVLFGAFSLMLGGEPTQGIVLSAAACKEPLSVGPWRSGEGMTLPEGRGKRSLKRLFTERGIEPAKREDVPVLRCGEKVAAVWGIGVEKKFAPAEGEETIVITIKNIKETSEG